MEIVKTEAFVDGIRCLETKQAVLLSPKKDFYETVAFALTYEAACALTTPAVQIRRVKMEDLSNGNIPEGGLSAREESKVCWTCNKEGHISRDCWQRWNGRMGLSSQQMRNKGRQVRCWTCRELGHISRHCCDGDKGNVGSSTIARPRWRRNGRITCWVCQKVGHISLDCWKKDRKWRKGLSPMQRDCKQRESEDKALVERDARANMIDVRRVRIISDDNGKCEAVREQQLNDPDLAVVMRYLEMGKRPLWREIAKESSRVKAYWRQWDSLRLENGCLKRIWENTDGSNKQSLEVVPREKVGKVLDECHRNSRKDHLGVKKMMAKIHQRFFWIGLRKSIVEWCQGCSRCAKHAEPELEVEDAGKGVAISNVIQYRGRARIGCFEKGQRVWLSHQQKKGSEVELRWDGPYVVVTRINDEVYRIKRSNGGEPKVVHIGRLSLRRRGGLDPVRDEQA